MEAYIGIGVLGFFVLIFIVAIVAGQRRARAMKAFAESKGFSYMPHAEDDEEFLQSFSRMPLFMLGRKRDAWNVMTGTVGDYHVTILDFRYSYDSAHTNAIGETLIQTVVVLDSPTQDMPTFSLRPHRHSDVVGNAFFSSLIPGLAELTPQDIDFPDHPAFSDYYFLHGTRKTRRQSEASFATMSSSILRNKRGSVLTEQAPSSRVTREARNFHPRTSRHFSTKLLK